eukprot:228773_1
MINVGLYIMQVFVVILYKLIYYVKLLMLIKKRSDWSDRSPITYAVRCGQLESVIELMKNGVNPIPPPDPANETPYKNAIYYKHESVIEFYKAYIKFVYNFDINNNTN